MSTGVVRTGIAAVLVLGTCVWLLTRDPSASMRSLSGTLAVRVLLADGTPAVGAEVRVGPGLDRFELSDPTPATQWSSFPAGADATASVPWPPVELDRVPIAARHGAQWGRIDVPATAPPGSLHTIQLQRDQTFVVRVVDGEGKPAPEVGVWLHGPPQQLHPEAIVRIEQGRTGGNGEVRFEHAQQWIADIEERDGVRPLTVSTSELAAAPAVELDANHLPAEPVTLQLAAFGCIEVATVEADGEPMTRGMLIVQAGDDRFWVDRPRDGGVVTCPVVALGQACRTWTPLLAQEPLEFAGPTRAGETVRVTLRADPCPVITGRLEHNGTPLRGARVQVITDSSEFGAATATTDDEGRFRVHGRSPGEKGQLTIESIDDRRRPTGLRAVWRGTPTTTGELDLGTVAMARDEELPLLVAGRVDTSAHLESVGLKVVRTVHSRPFDLDPPPIATIRADGSFEVRGTAAGESLQLQVQSGRHQHITAIPFRRGQQHLHVALEPDYEATVTASFAVASREVAMALRPVPHDVAADTDRTPVERSFDGRLLTCRWETATGRHELRVHGQEGPWLLKIPNVVVGKGEQHDVRLQRIELPDLRPLHIRVPAAQESEGVAYEPTQVKLLDDHVARDAAPFEQRSLLGLNDAAPFDERTFLVLTDAPVDLWVRVPGYRDRIVRGVHADTEVTLEPGIPVTLECTLADLPAGGGTSLDVFGTGYVSVQLRHGTAHLRLPAPGSYDLSGRHWSGDGSTTLRCAPDTIDVGENGGSFRVTLRPE
ncbi:MAG: hypothetical protein JNM25_06800 [Planctomycetes bacterium]|nr:hypothetical protein [Planctomycetota bacterium]